MTLSSATAASAALVATLLCAAEPSTAACPAKKAVAGVVMTLAESDGTLYFLRGGNKIAVYVAQVICDGDKVGPMGGKGKIGIQRADGKITYYSPKSKQNVVRAVGTKLKGWSLIVNWINEIVPRVEPYSIMTVGRDAPDLKMSFDIQSLAQSQAKMASGHTGLYVRWKGGSGPFALTLSDSEGTNVKELTGLPGGAAYLDVPHGLGAGRWTVTLKDKNGAQIVGAFDVDAAHKFEGTNVAAPFMELNMASTAVKMADDPQWAFEADQMVYAAPGQGLDRKPIYRVIACKSYGANPPDDCQ